MDRNRPVDKKKERPLRRSLLVNTGRDDWIRTSDPLLPQQLAVMLFWNLFARATRRLRQIFEFGEPVMHAMNGLLVMDMKCRLKVQPLDQDGWNINEACRWMVNINMPSTNLAPLTIAESYPVQSISQQRTL